MHVRDVTVSLSIMLVTLDTLRYRHTQMYPKVVIFYIPFPGPDSEKSFQLQL